MGKKNDNTLVKNASFLMVAALISKIIGMLYKSPLSTTLGSQSFALFQFAQNVYFILLMIASFSIPQAVSKIMAEKIAFHRYKDAQKVFYGALIYAAVAGGIVALICVFGAGILVPDSMANARLALQMLAPTIFMSGLCGVFRGYTSFRFFNISRADLRLPLPVAQRYGHRSALRRYLPQGRASLRGCLLPCYG